MKIGAIIQARMASTRLPGKVMKELPFGSGIRVLEQVIRRLRKTRTIGEIIVATTTNKEDDELVAISEKEGVNFFRGSEHDVLSRYYHAAREHSLDTIVRITSDCPCMDHEIVDHVISSHLNMNNDYTSNTSPRAYPHGMDVEVFNFEPLEKAFQMAEKDFEREHVTPYINRSGKFRLQSVEAPKELRRPDIRITLDTREDYTLLCAVYDYLYSENHFFGAKDIVNLFKRKPWLSFINENVLQKKVFNNLRDELEEAANVLGLQDLQRARDFIRGTLEKEL